MLRARGLMARREIETPQVAKKKIWEEVQPGLNTSAEGVARWKDVEMTVAAGPVAVKKIMSGNVA